MAKDTNVGPEDTSTAQEKKGGVDPAAAYLTGRRIAAQEQKLQEQKKANAPYIAKRKKEEKAFIKKIASHPNQADFLAVLTAMKQTTASEKQRLTELAHLTKIASKDLNSLAAEKESLQQKIKNSGLFQNIKNSLSAKLNGVDKVSAVNKERITDVRKDYAEGKTVNLENTKLIKQLVELSKIESQFNSEKSKAKKAVGQELISSFKSKLQEAPSLKDVAKKAEEKIGSKLDSLKGRLLAAAKANKGEAKQGADAKPSRPGSKV